MEVIKKKPKTVREILLEIEGRIADAIRNKDQGRADGIYHREWIPAQEAADGLYETRAE